MYLGCGALSTARWLPTRARRPLPRRRRAPRTPRPGPSAGSRPRPPRRPSRRARARPAARGGRDADRDAGPQPRDAAAERERRDRAGRDAGAPEARRFARDDALLAAAAGGPPRRLHAVEELEARRPRREPRDEPHDRAARAPLPSTTSPTSRRPATIATPDAAMMSAPSTTPRARHARGARRARAGRLPTCARARAWWKRGSARVRDRGVRVRSVPEGGARAPCESRGKGAGRRRRLTRIEAAIETASAPDRKVHAHVEQRDVRASTLRRPSRPASSTVASRATRPRGRARAPARERASARARARSRELARGRERRARAPPSRGPPWAARPAAADPRGAASRPSRSATCLRTGAGGGRALRVTSSREGDPVRATNDDGGGGGTHASSAPSCSTRVRLVASGEPARPRRAAQQPVRGRVARRAEADGGDGRDDAAHLGEERGSGGGRDRVRAENPEGTYGPFPAPLSPRAWSTWSRRSTTRPARAPEQPRQKRRSPRPSARPGRAARARAAPRRKQRRARRTRRDHDAAITAHPRTAAPSPRPSRRSRVCRAARRAEHDVEREVEERRAEARGGELGCAEVADETTSVRAMLCCELGHTARPTPRAARPRAPRRAARARRRRRRGRSRGRRRHILRHRVWSQVVMRALEQLRLSRIRAR